MKNLFCMVFILVVSTHSWAASFHVVTEESSSSFSLPFTFGTHKGTSSSVTGSAQMDPKTLMLDSAKIQIPIDSLKTGKKQMECHMREALGLDYSKSKFPKKHVCDNNNSIPKEGPDAIAYPDITFVVENSMKLTLGKNEVHGVWTVHGISKPSWVEVMVTRSEKDDSKIILEGSEVFTLEDYGIKVKPFTVVKVKDKAIATFHVVLAH